MTDAIPDYNTILGSLALSMQNLAEATRTQVAATLAAAVIASRGTEVSPGDAKTLCDEMRTMLWRK